MGIIAWFSLFKFNWLRRCRTCGVRGSKCLCRRPSLALEHIFFLEECKNRFGARNFSHVSNTMMTSSSTMAANSTNGTGTPSNFGGHTAVMQSSGSFLDNEVNPADYYYQSVPPPHIGSDDPLSPRLRKKSEKQIGRLTRRTSSKISSAADVSSATLVHKQSRHMTSMTRHNGDKDSNPPIMEFVAGDFVIDSEESTHVSLTQRQLQRQIVPHERRQSRAQSKSAKMLSSCKEESGVSFQFYGCNGNGSLATPIPMLMSCDRSISMGSNCSNNDSFMLRSSSISVSQRSDRVSLEANFGSLNPQSSLNNTGRRGYAPSIKEDEEAQALEKLTGWLHASSASTQDSFMLSR